MTLYFSVRVRPPWAPASTATKAGTLLPAASSRASWATENTLAPAQPPSSTAGSRD
jgi:hypothetical protein